MEVRGAGAIERVFGIPDSPVSGTLVGTARPLSALRLPFMADVDQILAVLQTNATTVAVSGTLRKPQVRTTTLDEVSEAVRALLLGDVQREQRRRSPRIGSLQSTPGFSATRRAGPAIPIAG